MRREILFLCTGNTCRSPMAEALLRSKLPEKSEIRVSSAGLFAQPGRKASDMAKETMASRGLSLTNHRSRQVTEEMLRSADHVLCMTAGHGQMAIEMAPDAKISVLGPFVGVPEDVVDPYGGRALAYELCAKQLEGLIEKLAALLQEDEA